MAEQAKAGSAPEDGLCANGSSKDAPADVEKGLPGPDSDSDSVPQSLYDSALAASKAAAESYSAFTQPQRLTIIILCSITSLISPLSATLYIPAIPQLASYFHTSTSAINLTITTYLVLQGISPTLWASVGESMGRRQLYIALLVVYMGACSGLAFAKTYVAVLVLRALQSAGSASTGALGAGIISDLVHVSRRGGYMGNYVALAGIGTAFGPVLGGVFAEFTGWRGIFVFLMALAGFLLIMVVLLIPETHRAHVGDGSIPSPRYLRPPFPWLSVKGTTHAVVPDKKKLEIDLLAPIKLMVQPDALCLTLFTGLIFAVWQMHMLAAAALYAKEYHLNDLEIGLTYVSNGVGSLTGSIMTGRVLQMDYKRRLRKESEEAGEPLKEVRDIERARLMSFLYPTVAFVASVVAFGWVIHYKTHVAGPITLSFFVGGLSTYLFAAASTLIVDIFAKQSFAATAAMNVSRCVLSAVGAAAVGPMTDKLGSGWAFTTLGLICAVTYPLIIIEVRYGRRWREKRTVREAAIEAKKEEEREKELQESSGSESESS